MPSHRLLTFRQMGGLLATTVAFASVTAVVSPPAFAAPANDTFTSATPIQNAYSYGSNLGATRQTGEPNHAGTAGEASIWYTWTAPADATVTLYSYLEVRNTGFSTHALAVYTGGSVSSLVPVVSRSEIHNQVSFIATAGSTYKFAIDSTLANAGIHELQLYAVPSNDDFGAPKVVSGKSGNLSGTNVRATKQSFEPNHAGGYGGSSVWYSWTAPANGAATFDTHGSKFDTLLGIYTGGTLTSLSQVASNDDCEGSALGNSCAQFNAVAGTTYRIAVDGFGYVEGDLSLTWTGGGCTITGTAGADLLTGTAGNDVICGLGGDDAIKGQGGDDTLIGGPGTDKADFADAPAGVTASLSTGTATGQGSDTLSEIESIDGSPHPDRLEGDALNNILAGKAGNDMVSGQSGVDQVFGGDGDDAIHLGDGNDKGQGGTGTDTVNFGVAVSVDLTAGTATGQGSDTLGTIENVTGSAAVDILRGTAGVNILSGGAGNDTILGEDGNDTLNGQDGNDRLTGGVGTDRCDGGVGTDTATTCETRVAIP